MRVFEADTHLIERACPALRRRRDADRTSKRMARPWTRLAAALACGVLFQGVAARAASITGIPLDGLGAGCVEEIRRGRTLELVLSSTEGEAANVCWRGEAQVNETGDSLLLEGLEEGAGSRRAIESARSWRIESARVLRGTEKRPFVIVGAMLGGSAAALLVDEPGAPWIANAGVFLLGSLVGAICGSLLADERWEPCDQRRAEGGP